MKTISSFGVAPITTHCWSGDGSQVAMSFNNKEVKVRDKEINSNLLKQFINKQQKH